MTDKRKNDTAPAAGQTRSAELPAIQLLKPKPGAGSVLQLLKKRKTVREIGEKKLSARILSDLLWAADGVNRNKMQIGDNGRTAASASNSQEIDIYAVMEEGTFFYNASEHRLVPVSEEDLRPLAIGRGQVRLGDHAPVRLIYVADIHKLTHTKGFQEPGLQDPEVQKSYYFVDTGLIAGNVYLFAASLGLASWFHNCDKSALAQKLKLRGDQRVLFGQTVGYPAKK